MEKIITEIYKIIKETEHLMAFEESIQRLMHEVFSQVLGQVFGQLNRAIVMAKQKAGWKVQRTDEKTLQFIFGAVRFPHTLTRTSRNQ